MTSTQAFYQGVLRPSGIRTAKCLSMELAIEAGEKLATLVDETLTIEVSGVVYIGDPNRRKDSDG